MEDQQPLSPLAPKRNLRKPILLLLLVLFSLGLGFYIGNQAPRQQEPADSDTTESDQAELLFVMDGDVVIEGDKLTIIDDTIEWFTNRPERDVGRMSSQDFIAIWEDGDLDADPPNAAFSNLSAVVELRQPELTETGLRFNFKTTSGELKDGTLTDASLYVDAFPTAVNDQITDAATQSSSDDGYCWFDQAPWQVVGTVKYNNDTMTCEQRDEIMSQLLEQVELKSYDFSLHITVDSPEPNTDWLCAGPVRPFNSQSPWQIESANCDPTDLTLKESFGFEIDGQTSLSD